MYSPTCSGNESFVLSLLTHFLKFLSARSGFLISFPNFHTFVITSAMTVEGFALSTIRNVDQNNTPADNTHCNTKASTGMQRARRFHRRDQPDVKPLRHPLVKDGVLRLSVVTVFRPQLLHPWLCFIICAVALPPCHSALKPCLA